jgi:hypothetical protein
MPSQPAAKGLFYRFRLAVVQKIVAGPGKIVDFSLGQPTGKIHSSGRIDDDIGRGVKQQNRQAKPMGLVEAALSTAHQFGCKSGPRHTAHVGIRRKGGLLLG